MASAGNCCKASGLKPERAEGFPLMRILTLPLPLRLILPSTSTETEGTLSNTSVTDPPFTVKS